MPARPSPSSGRRRRPSVTTRRWAPSSARSSEISPDFRAWWPEHDVAGFETRIRRFDHPRAGRLTFEYQQLTPAEWPALRVVVQLGVPGDDSARRLAVTHEAF